MSMHTIEPGQRLQTLVGEQLRFVQVLAEAVVPAGYWLCREEASSQSRVIAQTALAPIPAELVTTEPVTAELVPAEPIAAEPVTAASIVAEPIEQIAPQATVPTVAAQAVMTAAA